jgi:uncharacterized protein (TIGR04141 family)
MTTTKTFSLYLAKTSVTSPDDLITESAKTLVASRQAERITSNGLGNESILFIFPGVPASPKWVKDLKSIFEIKSPLTSRSPCALVIFPHENRLFAVTFSFGRIYLDDAKTEADFGLKVAVNAVNDNKLRSVEHSNIGAAIRDFTQAAGRRDLRAFGFDEALDLIRKVSGYTTDEDFAELVTGSRALRFSKKMDLADVPSLAKDALAIFGQRTYQETAFKIIDFLSPVLDSELSTKLDEKLVEAV